MGMLNNALEIKVTEESSDNNTSSQLNKTFTKQQASSVIDNVVGMSRRTNVLENDESQIIGISGDLTKSDVKKQIISSQVKPQVKEEVSDVICISFFGIIGVMEINAEIQLWIVCDIEPVGNIDEAKVQRVLDTHLIPLMPSYRGVCWFPPVKERHAIDLFSTIPKTQLNDNSVYTNGDNFPNKIQANNGPQSNLRFQ